MEMQLEFDLFDIAALSQNQSGPINLTDATGAYGMEFACAYDAGESARASDEECGSWFAAEENQWQPCDIHGINCPKG